MYIIENSHKTNKTWFEIGHFHSNESWTHFQNDKEKRKRDNRLIVKNRFGYVEHRTHLNVVVITLK